jgi:hypothetical protein
MARKYKIYPESSLKGSCRILLCPLYWERKPYHWERRFSPVEGKPLSLRQNSKSWQQKKLIRAGKKLAQY